MMGRRPSDIQKASAKWWAILVLITGMALPSLAPGQETNEPPKGATDAADPTSPAEPSDQTTVPDKPSEKSFQTSTGSAGFPKIPQVNNLTEGFRIEKKFKSIAVAPTNRDVVYIGTKNGLIYTSKDGGETWVEHDLVNRPQPRTIELKAREGFPVKFYELYPGMQGGVRRYAEGFNWPGEALWELPELDPTTMMQTEPFRLADVRPPSVTLFDEFGGLQISRLFTRAEFWLSAPTLGPSLGKAPKIGRGDSLIVYWLSVHPKDEDTVFAATNDGLFRSEDGGYSWVREFDNPLADRRVSYHVNFYPEDPGTRFLCTKHGLFITEDNGESYSKVEDSIINRIGCYYVTFHPERPRELWVGTVFGVWVSNNFGKTFGLRFYTRVPGQIQIRKVAFDPDNADNILLGSSEIVFLSRDGGKTFTRVGVYSFTKQKVQNVLFGDKPGHLIVATDRDVWRTTDWGETWESVVFGNTGWFIEWMTFPRGPGGPLWVLSEGELLELTTEVPRDLSESELRRLEKLLSDEPSMTQTMIQSMRAHDVWRPALNRKRRRAKSSHLLPELQAVATYRPIYAELFNRGLVYGTSTADPIEDSPEAFASDGTFQDWHFEAWGNWDLGSLIFDKRVLPKGKNFQYNRELAMELRESIQLVYAERRRLQIKQIADPHADARTMMFRENRVEELTQLLDIMTDDWFGKNIE